MFHYFRRSVSKMENESSSKFMSTLAEFMHFLCTKYVDFDQSVVVSGQLSMDVDARGISLTMLLAPAV